MKKLLSTLIITALLLSSALVVNTERVYADELDMTDLANAEVTIDDGGKEYCIYNDGKELKPNVIVKFPGATNPVPTDAYTVTYSNNKQISTEGNVAHATVTAVNGKGYHGTKTIEFTIIGKTPGIEAGELASGLVYNKSNQNLLSKAYSLKEGTEGTIAYAITDGENDPPEPTEYSTSIPQGLNAGTYHIWMNFTSALYKGFATVTQYIGSTVIDKATPVVTAPIGYSVFEDDIFVSTELEYNGENQTLIKTAGSTTGGVLQYALDSTADDAWSEDLPEAKDAKTYTVYYKVFGDENYYNVEPASIYVMIDKGPATYTVDPDETEYTYDGTAKKLSVEAKSDDGKVVYSRNQVDWSETIPEAIDADTYTVYVKIIGDDNHYDSDVTTLSTTIKKADPTYTAPEAKDLTYNGNDQELVSAGISNHGTFKYSTDENEWSDDIPKGKTVNDYDVFYKLIADKNHNDIESTKVTDVKIKKYEVEVPTINSVVYNGQPQTANVDRSNSLYKVNTSVEDATKTDVGSYDIVFELKDTANYKWKTTDSSTVTVKFNITEKEFTDENGVTLDKTNFTYNGEEQKPVETVKDGQVELTKNTDYEVTYLDADGNVDACINAGTKKVKVTFKGNYSGSIEKEFTISPKEITEDNINYTTVNYVYNGTEIEPVYTVTSELTAINTATLEKDKDFTVSYSGNRKDVTNSPVIFTITAQGNYKGTINKSFTIEARNISNVTATVNPTEVTYTGEPLEVTVTVTDTLGTTVTLELNKDYTLDYKNTNINAGEASVYVIGIGNYKDEKVKNFTINKAEILVSDITLDSEFVYTGSAITPTVKVVHNEKELVENTDYRVYLSDNTAIGDATIKIQGIGNYSTKENGEEDEMIHKTFKIVPITLDKDDISNIDVSYVYTENAIEPLPTVTHGLYTLEKDVDYEVTYVNNTDVSSISSKAKVEVTGKGIYQGTISKEFNIVKAKLENLSITWDEPTKSYEYNGFAIVPEFTIKNGDIELVKGTDYTVVCSNNVNVTASENKAIAKVTLTKTGYEDVQNFAFEITPKTIVGKSSLATDGYEYSGEGVYPFVTVTDTELAVGAQPVTADDYTVSYENNTTVGTATVKVTGKRNYYGEESLQFTIHAKPIDSLAFKLPQQSYKFIDADTAIEPVLTIKDGSYKLVKDVDYTIDSYTNNKQIGTAYINVTGIGNYCSTKSVSFKIESAPANVEQLDNGDLVISYEGDDDYLNQLTEIGPNNSVTIDFGSGNVVTLTNTETDTPLVLKDGKVTIDYEYIKEYNSVFEKGPDKTFNVKLNADTYEEKEADVVSKRGIEIIDVSEVKEGYISTDIYVDGEKIEGTLVTVYDCRTRIVETFKNHYGDDINDLHTQYPESFKVWRITQVDGFAAVEHLEGLDSVMEYAGTSIRLVGNKGIRIITSINKNDKNNLIKSDIEGYTLLEYGTILGWASNLTDSEPIMVQATDGKYSACTYCASGYAYRVNKMDAVFKKDTNNIYYTNVLVDTNNAWEGKYNNDFAMRSYMILRPEDATDASQDVVIYGGTLYRSISYVAKQVIGNYKKGTDTYKYLESLIPVEGD